MKNVLISGYYGFENIGDEAILEALSKKLKDNGLSVSVLSDDPIYTTELFKVESYHRAVFSEIISAIRNCDVLISGGGSLFQDTTSVRSIWYYLGIIMLAKLFKKPVYVLYQGIGPINNKFNRFLTRLILNNVKRLVVRDEISLEFLKELEVTKPQSSVTSDAVFMLDKANEEKIINTLEKFGVNLESEKPIFGLALRSWKEIDKIEEFARLGDKLVEAYGAQIVFFALHNDEDYYLAKQIEEKMKNKLYIVSGHFLPSEIMTMMGKMDINVGIRLHSLIFSAKMGIPLLGISYDPKIDGFLDMLGMSSVCTYDEINSDTIFNAIDWIMKNGFPIEELDESVEKFSATAEKTLMEIKEEISK